MTIFALPFLVLQVPVRVIELRGYAIDQSTYQPSTCSALHVIACHLKYAQGDTPE